MNILQNGKPDHRAPQIRTAADAMALKAKADFIAAWRAGVAPKAYHGKSFDAGLPKLVVLSPVSSFITHRLFSPFGGPWLGKKMGKDGSTGVNRFQRSGDVVTYEMRIGPSHLDGKPALILDYSKGDSLVWGSIMGMRDEIREVAPGVWLGIGAFWAAGGIHNCAPFVLWPAN